MKKTTSAAILFSALFILVIGLQATFFAAANPLPPPVIRVESPTNNQVYPSGEVWLNFTRFPDTDYVTSITYSLDGHAEISTNGSTLLSGLPAGSHSLALYAKLSADRDDYGFMITKIYFSTYYSTAWVTFATVFIAVLATGLLALFFIRRRLTAALKRKKTEPFWIGLGVLLLGALFFGLLVEGAAYDYLFPVHHSGLVVNNPYPCLFLSLFFISVGLVLMRRGIKKEQAHEGVESNLTQEREEGK